MRNIAILLFSLFSTIILNAQDNELVWPRAIEAGNYKITLYQPQFDSLVDNKLAGRLALSVKDREDKLLFGALWFKVILNTDLDSRIATLESFDISKILFPDIKNDKNIETLKTVISDDFEKININISVDKLLASLDKVATEKQISSHLDNSPPKIYFRQTPTVLVSIDGDPKFKTVEGKSIEYVVNTPFFIVKRKDYYYLKGADFWYKTKDLLSGTWKTTTSVPSDVENLADKNASSQQNPQKDQTDGKAPKLIVVTKPSELIVSKGDLAYEPIKNTTLLLVTNTESDLLLDIETQTHYLLLNGRWYGTTSLKSEKWAFVEPNKLPKTFLSIPADNEDLAILRVSIPGTEEAKEALYEQQLPQTATVSRKDASTTVSYDGKPKFKKVEGTNLSYAINTESTVLYINQTYYAVANAVWFESSSAEGPWIVSTKRPEGVEDIPPSSPVYNVKYVYIYDSTPDVVYVGYTPGYYHSYMYGGVIVYGSGYYYQPWYGAYYYPRPVTYGFAVHYNPYTGWGFAVGMSYGWVSMSFHSAAYWGPSGYRHGYRHGYYHGYNRGYAAGYVHGKNHSNNIYRKANGTPRKGISYKSRPATGQLKRPSQTKTTRNNLYSDKSGNIYQRDANGNWEQKRNTTNKTNTTPKNTRPSSTYQRQQLETQYNNRNRGNTNYNNFRSRSMPQRSSMGRRR